MKLFLALLLIPALLLAQTAAPVIAAGTIYQTFSQNGGAYISPTAGAAVLSQRSALNWKSILFTVLSQGTLWTPAAGLSGLISIPTKASAGLVIAHGAYDNYFSPILQEAQPAGSANIAPVLQLTGSMAPTSAACAENSIFATSMQGIPAPLKKTIPRPVVTSVSGVTVTYTPQGAQVLKNAAGSYIKKFMVVDVLACLPPAPAPAITRASIDTSHIAMAEPSDEVLQQRIDKIMKARAEAFITTSPDVAQLDRQPVTITPAPLPEIRVVSENPQVNLQQFSAQIRALRSQLDNLQAQMDALSKQ